MNLNTEPQNIRPTQAPMYDSFLLLTRHLSDAVCEKAAPISETLVLPLSSLGQAERRILGRKTQICPLCGDIIMKSITPNV